MKAHYPFTNIPLPYEYSALEPHIDEKTMHLHHDKHLQGYIDNLNKSLENKPMLQGMGLEELIVRSNRRSSPEALIISRNAGGVYNHRFYFESMTPYPIKEPIGRIAEAINREFGGLDSLQSKLREAAISVFGSGYAWLCSNARGWLSVMTSANQETPLSKGLCPLLNIDVWEHAYYLKHYNKRSDYIEDFFKVIDWFTVNDRYLECLQSNR